MGSRSHRAAAAALAAVGVLVAHALAYRLTVTDVHERAHLLAESGHGWWGLAPYLAGGALACFALALGRSERIHDVRWSLAPLQVLLYVGIEFGERLFGGHHHGLVHLPTLVTGSAIALALGLLAAVFLHASERLVAALRTPEHLEPNPSLCPVPLRSRFVDEPTQGARAPRGPPLPACS